MIPLRDCGARLFLALTALTSSAGLALAWDASSGGFPLEIQAGIDDPAAAGLGGTLPDLPFDSARGYGHVGGEAGTRERAAASGGDPRWPLSYREGLRKLSFRVPNGEYLVRLVFLETEAAAPGLRVFDVRAEGETALAGVDIAAEAGDFAWHPRETLAAVRDGWLDLDFEARAGSRPPRVSRIRIEPAGAVPDTPPAPPRLRADPGYHQAVLRWEPPGVPGIAGYGLFRSESADGPFESLTALPFSSPRFVHDLRGSGAAGFYRVRAYGVRGGQSPLGEPAAARADGPPGSGLKALDLRVAEPDLRRLFLRGDPPAAVSGELHHLGSHYPVEVSCLGGDARWQGKKSYRLRLSPESRRGLFGRRELHLLAEAGDPTLLREKLAAGLDRLLGLAAPEAAHFHLLLNGRYQGIYLDREAMGGAFRQRAGLDRFGALTRAGGRLRLRPGWEPYGETRGQSGDLRGLAHLVHELHRVNDAELDAYFEERFYLDRLFYRLASAAVRAVDPAIAGAEPPPYLIEDSRNGKWEFFPGDRQGGDFGIEDFRPLPGAAYDPRRARRSLLGWALGGEPGEKPGGQGAWSGFGVLETRLLGRPELRARYLSRVEEICRDLLTPERFDEVLAGSRAPLASAMFPEGEGAGGPPRDPRLWPEDGGLAFRGAPAALGAFYRAHREALLAAVAEDRARPREALTINEIHLRPGSATGEAALSGSWIEIHNSSPSPVDLGGYSLTDDLDRPRVFPLPAGAAVGPGETRLVQFGGGGPSAAAISCPLRPSPDGGELGLFRSGPDGRTVPVDTVFYGRQSEGISSSRLPDGSSAWALVASPTPASANRGQPLTAPPWRWRSGVELKKSKETTVWVQWSGGPEAVPEAAIHIGKEGGGDFERKAIAYQKDAYRYEHSLEEPPGGQALSYYFTARTAEGVERAYPLPGPLAPLRLSAPPPLSMNEVLPRPTRGGPLGEFVEIYNGGDQKVSVDGMFLSDDRRNSTKFRIRAPEPIPPKGFLVIHTDGRGEGTHASFRLGNAGEYLGLFGRSEEGNLLIDQMAFPAVPVDKSYGREREGGKGFKVWKDPTPGARNIPRIPPEYLKRKGGEAPPAGAGKEAPPPDPEPDPPEDER